MLHNPETAQSVGPVFGPAIFGASPSSSSSAESRGGGGDQARERLEHLVGWARRAWQVNVAEEAEEFFLLRKTVDGRSDVATGPVKHPLAPPVLDVALFPGRVAGAAEAASVLPVRGWWQTGASAVPGEVPFKHAEDPRASNSIAWGRLESKVNRWSSLPDDWDGDGGVCPTREVVDAAKAFLKRARIVFLPVPQGYVAGDGEIGFRWRRGDAFASAAFLPDGHIVIFCKAGGSPALRIDEPYSAELDLSGFFDALSIFA